jgi:hypothetical protein
MVVFLAGDAKRVNDLEDASWKSIAGTSERIAELDLSAQQAAQARGKLTSADRTVDLRITDAYHWLLIPEQPDPARPLTWSELKVDGSRNRLAERASDKVRPSPTCCRSCTTPATSATTWINTCPPLADRPHRGRRVVVLPLQIPLPSPAPGPCRPRRRRHQRREPSDLGRRSVSRLGRVANNSFTPLPGFPSGSSSGIGGQVTAAW